MEDPVRFLDHFAGRSDVYAEQQADGSYRPVHATIGPEQVFEMNDGKATYGLYTVRADNTTRVLVFDIDTGDYADAERIQDTLELLGVDPDQVWTEFSGRKGWHIWMFLASWVPADVCYRAVRGVLRVAGMEGTEAWPKQPGVSGLDRKLGNLIRYPLTVHRINGQRSHAVPEGRTWYRPRVSTAQVEALAEHYVEVERHEPAGTPEEGYKKKLPCIVRISTGGVQWGMQDDSMYTLALDCKRRGLPEADALEECRKANETFQPPLKDWHVNQKVRSAYGGTRSGFDCAASHLHRSDMLLCSRKCPRYPAIAGMPATDDAPLGAAGGGGAVYSNAALPKVGDEVTLTVAKVYRRQRDNRAVVHLEYPGAEQAIVVFDEEEL